MMFSLLSLSVLTLAASSASGLAVPRGEPSNWSTSLEPYNQYHERYLSIGCQNMHDNKEFFDRCCHPVSKYAQPDSSCSGPTSSPEPDYGSEPHDDCHDSDEPEDDETDYTPPGFSNAPELEEKVANVDAVVTTNVDASTLGGGWQTGGFATFYYQNGNAGACGQKHGDYELIAAMDDDRYGPTNKHSSLCGKRVKIINTKNNKSVTVTIADACPTCKNGNSIDLSVGAFHKIATEEEGMVPIKWQYV